MLWVLPGNARARRFYEREGWRHQGVDRVLAIRGMELDETRYGRDLGTPHPHGRPDAPHL